MIRVRVCTIILYDADQGETSYFVVDLYDGL